MGNKTEKLSLVIQQKMVAWVAWSRDDEPFLRLSPIDGVIDGGEVDEGDEVVWVDVATDVASYQAADDFIKNRKKAGIYLVSTRRERVLTEVIKKSYRLS